jgi:hypothetical protein
VPLWVTPRFDTGWRTRPGALTDLGNRDFRIRHHEGDTVALDESSHLGYVFYRMLSLIGLLVRHAG